MITIISASNRRDSEALRFSRKFLEMIRARTNEPVHLLSLEGLPGDMIHPDMYERSGQSSRVGELQDQYILPADKFFFVVPEYNGSFPGVLKAFLDAVSVRQYSQNFQGKKAALVGIASGRAGNLLGMDHLTGVLHHLGVIVMPHKLPISRIEELVDEDGEIIDLETLKVMEQQVEAFLGF